MSRQVILTLSILEYPILLAEWQEEIMEDGEIVDVYDRHRQYVELTSPSGPVQGTVVDLDLDEMEVMFSANHWSEDWAKLQLWLASHPHTSRRFC